jgi:hypothetical protein
MSKIGPYSTHATLQKLDGRSREARLMKSLRAELISHVGGKPSVAQTVLIDQATKIQLRIEMMDRDGAPADRIPRPPTLLPPFAAPLQSTSGQPATAGGFPRNNCHAAYWLVSSAPALLKYEAPCLFHRASGIGHWTSLAPCNLCHYGSAHRIAGRIAPAVA